VIIEQGTQPARAHEVGDLIRRESMQPGLRQDITECRRFYLTHHVPIYSAFAFAPGDWMKHLIEMAAFIDAHQSRRFSSYIDADALRRASKINP
jgi:hypothetical protein